MIYKYLIILNDRNMFNASHNKSVGFISAMICLFLILFGTYFRIRDNTDVPSFDLLIMLRLIVSGIGIVVGLYYISKLKHNIVLNKHDKLIICYLLSILLSSIFSEYSFAIIGYFILIFGYCIFLIFSLKNVVSINDIVVIEKWIFFTIVILILKDSSISFYNHFISDTMLSSEPSRLGMGVTHATEISLLSICAFWLSFQNWSFIVNKIVIMSLRLIFVTVVCLSRSRISIICLCLSFFLYLYYKNKNVMLFLIPLICSILIATIILGVNDNDTVIQIINLFNRNQELDTILSMTGRTDIWRIALDKILLLDFTLIFGYGYGVSRLILNSNVYMDFFPAHCHNTFLEITLTCGLVGLIVLFLIIYNTIKNTIKMKKLNDNKMNLISLHYMQITTIILVPCLLTEPFLANRLNSFSILFIFYFLIFNPKKVYLR